MMKKEDKVSEEYWYSLTPMQQFEWEHWDIDPRKPRRNDIPIVCLKHLRENCVECKKDK